MLEKEIAPVVRANLIIALGDLSFKFPNNVEPWTPKMYARLHDMSIKVGTIPRCLPATTTYPSR